METLQFWSNQSWHFWHLLICTKPGQIVSDFHPPFSNGFKVFNYLESFFDAKLRPPLSHRAPKFWPFIYYLKCKVREFVAVTITKISSVKWSFWNRVFNSKLISTWLINKNSNYDIDSNLQLKNTMNEILLYLYIDHIFMATSFIERMHYLLIVSISALSALTTNVVVNLLHVQRSWSFIIIVVITGTTFSAFIDIFLSFLKIFLKNQNLLGIYTI